MDVSSLIKSGSWLTQYVLSSPKPWHSSVLHREQILGARPPRGPQRLRHPHRQLTKTRQSWKSDPCVHSEIRNLH